MGIVREFKKKQRRRYMKIGAGILILILIVLGVYLNFDSIEENVPESWFSFEASGVIQHHNDFYSREIVLNPETGDQFLYFINQYPSINFFTKTYESPSIISYTEGTHLTTGTGCDWGELIRFTYCDNRYDKNSCNSDVFTNLWQIHKAGNYPDFYNYYTSDNTFYFSYSCYNSNFASYGELSSEARWLDGDKCVNTVSKTFGATEYDSTKECLEALDNLPTDKVYNCYLCKDGWTDYKQVTQDSDWSCQQLGTILYTTTEAQCKSIHPEYFQFEPEEEQYTCFKCEDNNLGATIITQDTGWSCRQLSGTLYTISLAQCKALHPEYFTQDDDDGDDDDTPDDSDDTTTPDGDGDSDINCTAYEKVTDGTCSFCLAKVVTTAGITEYYEDHPAKLIIFTIFILILGWIAYDIWFKKKGDKK